MLDHRRERLEPVAANSAAPAAHAAPKASRIGGLVAETIVLVNPQRNYAQFLLRAGRPPGAKRIHPVRQAVAINPPGTNAFMVCGLSDSFTENGAERGRRGAHVIIRFIPEASGGRQPVDPPPTSA